MSVWAVVPVKDLDRAKQRLAPDLTALERRRLALAMCSDVLDALAAVRGLSGIAVVTGARDVVPPGLRWIEDPGGGLNAALARAAVILQAQGATAMLSVAADVPLANCDEIEAVLSAGRTTPVVIVPDREDRGTNALLLAPPTRIPPAFGGLSLARHLLVARACGIEPAVLRLSGLGFDVDDAAALDDLRRATAGHPAYRFLTPALQAVP
jgi:2-phospho-L-lactate/phosphoenolpyruvate guanylyltransferase